MGSENVPNEAGKHAWTIAVASWAVRIVAYLVLIFGSAAKSKALIIAWIIFAIDDLAVLSVYVLLVGDKIMTGVGMVLATCTIVVSFGAIRETKTT